MTACISLTAPASEPRFNLLPRASVRDVLFGDAPLVGARLREDLPRGLFSPVEARVTLGLGYEDLGATEGAYLDARSWRRDLGIVARAALATALFGSREAVAHARPWIVSAHVDNVTIAEAVDLVFAPPPTTRARIVHFVHAHALTLARYDSALAGALAAADVVLPDGIGIRVAATILGTRMLDNLNGTDMLPLLCRRATEEGVPLVLIGGAAGIAEACAERLREAHPGLDIPLVSHGFPTPEETEAFKATLATLGRCIVLVGMGSPVQERWTRAHLAPLGGVTALTVGGLFDFYSGRIARAPVALRELGLEWAWRLAKEPARLARRYLLGNPHFVGLALLDAMSGETHALLSGQAPATEARAA